MENYHNQTQAFSDWLQMRNTKVAEKVLNLICLDRFSVATLGKVLFLEPTLSTTSIPDYVCDQVDIFAKESGVFTSWS